MSIKIFNFPLCIAIIVLIFGMLFKVMHWPFASILMLIGGISIGSLYVIRFISKKNKFYYFLIYRKRVIEHVDCN
ncbi:GldL-related protein [Winogradskyella forsetii]|uniref:GldL-related protein n=1 Tax=Winogradskyella forsetii TaxID=2686077 RepID=UPI0035293F67